MSRVDWPRCFGLFVDLSLRLLNIGRAAIAGPRKNDLWRKAIGVSPFNSGWSRCSGRRHQRVSPGLLRQLRALSAPKCSVSPS